MKNRTRVPGEFQAGFAVGGRPGRPAAPVAAGTLRRAAAEVGEVEDLVQAVVGEGEGDHGGVATGALRGEEGADAAGVEVVVDPAGDRRKATDHRPRPP